MTNALRQLACACAASAACGAVAAAVFSAVLAWLPDPHAGGVASARVDGARPAARSRAHGAGA